MEAEKFLLLKEGMEFTKTTKGFISTSTETLFVQLIDFAPATKSLKWKVCGGKATQCGDLQFSEIDRIQSTGDTTWSILKNTKETVLQLDAKDAESRDKWVEELQDALQEVKDNAESLCTKTLTPVEQVKAKVAKEVRRNSVPSFDH